MIRITQTYLINQAIRFYETKGWTTLYYDLPLGRRSGVGKVSSINRVWEGLYNLSPDIVFEKEGSVLLFEVDSTINQGYISKFEKYSSKEAELLAELGSILKVSLCSLYFGFVSQTNRFPLSIKMPFRQFRFVYLENGVLQETFLSSSLE